MFKCSNAYELDVMNGVLQYNRAEYIRLAFKGVFVRMQ